MELEGARAFVTGGSSGIGAATVAALARAGAKVVVLDVQEPRPDSGASGAEGYVACDVADEASVVAAVAAVNDLLGGIEVAVANAGVGGMAPLLQMTTAEWDRVLGVNLRGAMLTMREAAKAMVAAGTGGAIVATSSVSASSADRTIAHYVASKAGLSALVKVAANELGPHRIRVNAVAPGTTETPMFAQTALLPGYHEALVERTPLGRLGPAAGVADAIVALCRLDWVTGHVLTVDGGVTLHSAVDATDWIRASWPDALRGSGA